MGDFVGNNANANVEAIVAQANRAKEVKGRNNLKKLDLVDLADI